jgi:hypothetical protein
MVFWARNMMGSDYGTKTLGKKVDDHSGSNSLDNPSEMA